MISHLLIIPSVPLFTIAQPWGPSCQRCICHHVSVSFYVLSWLPNKLSLRNQDTFIATTPSKFARQARFQQRQHPQHLVLGSCRLLGTVAINVQKTLGQRAEGDLVTTTWSLNPEVLWVALSICSCTKQRNPTPKLLMRIASVYMRTIENYQWYRCPSLGNRYHVIHVDGLKEPVFVANKWQKQIRHNVSTKAGKPSSSSPYLASVAFKCFFKE